jgi:hypothetical protein
MPETPEKLLAQIDRLRRQVADAEAALGTLKTRLATAEAKATGDPAPVSGLDLLWAAALPISRTRSSKHQCRTEWHRIPRHDRPTIAEMVRALKLWNRCDEWKKDGNAYAQGLHRWIKARQWENIPDDAKNDPLARYRCKAPAPAPQPTAEDAAALVEFLKFRPSKHLEP